eukprot:1871741-Rhodomonas_salina.2
MSGRAVLAAAGGGEGTCDDMPARLHSPVPPIQLLVLLQAVERRCIHLHVPSILSQLRACHCLASDLPRLHSPIAAL